jgi:hypothetical protein
METIDIIAGIILLIPLSILWWAIKGKDEQED